MSKVTELIAEIEHMPPHWLTLTCALSALQALVAERNALLEATQAAAEMIPRMNDHDYLWQDVQKVMALLQQAIESAESEGK